MSKSDIVIKTIKGYTGSYECIISPKRSITVTRFNKAGGAESKPRTFRIGDMAEYDSYNLSYYGEIVSITEKTVTIKPRYENKTRRLSLDSFSWRNYNFDLAETAKSNFETSMYI